MTSLSTKSVPTFVLFASTAILFTIFAMHNSFPTSEAFDSGNCDADLKALDSKYKTLLKKQNSLYETLLDNYNKMIENLNKSADSAQQAAKQQTALSSTLASL